MKAANIFLSIVSMGVVVGGEDPKVIAEPPVTAVQPEVVQPQSVPLSGPAPAVSGPPDVQSPGGTITTHKNPDGSTLTVTNFNGPLPANAFPTMQMPHFGGFGMPFFMPFWGYPPFPVPQPHPEASNPSPSVVPAPVTTPS